MSERSAGLTITHDEISYSRPTLGASVGWLIGLAVLVGFVGLVAFVLLATWSEALREPGVWAVIRVVVATGLAGLVGWGLVGSLRSGSLLNLLLLGHAPPAMRRVTGAGEPMLHLERRLPFGRVWIVKRVPLRRLGPISIHRAQRAWGEFPPLDMACGEYLFPLFVSENQAVTSIAAYLRTWLREVDPPSPALRRVLPFSPADRTHACSAIDFSPDAKRVACAGWDNRVRIWNLADGRLTATLAMTAQHAIAIRYSPDGSLLACAGWFDSIREWNLSRGGPGCCLDGFQLTPHNTIHGLKSLAYSPDGKMLALADPDAKEVRRWQADGGVRYDALREAGRKPWAVAFSPDGRLLAAGEVVWDLTREQRVAVLEGKGWVDCLAFSPDGTLLAAGWSDGRVRVVRLPAAEPVATLEAPTAGWWSGSLQFSPDGRTLAWAGGADGAIRLWDVPAWTPRATLVRHGSPILALAFAPDGATLLSAGEDAEVRFWDVAPPAQESANSPPHPPNPGVRA